MAYLRITQDISFSSQGTLGALGTTSPRHPSSFSSSYHVFPQYQPAYSTSEILKLNSLLLSANNKH